MVEIVTADDPIMAVKIPGWDCNVDRWCPASGTLYLRAVLAIATQNSELDRDPLVLGYVDDEIAELIVARNSAEYMVTNLPELLNKA